MPGKRSAAAASLGVPAQDKRRPEPEKQAAAAAVEISKLVDIITSKFDSIQNAPPLTLKDGALIPLFDQAEFIPKTKDGRPYKCSCSVFALNIIDILSPSVPICSRQVEELKCMFFPDGQPPSVDNQHEICVEVTKKDMVMQQAWGSFRQISPIEMTVAMLRACVRDVESPVDHSAEWEKCLRSIPMSFKFCENSEETFMHSVA